MNVAHGDDWCRSDDSSDDGQLRIRLRHTTKAVIGYGDALLYAHGDYHWSYAEKRRRMQSLEAVSEPFRKLYDRAAEIRFSPPETIDEEFCWLSHEALGLLEAVHLEFEPSRLATTMHDWDDYLETALAHGVWEDVRDPIGVARSVRNALKSSDATTSIASSKRSVSDHIPLDDCRAALITPAKG